MPSRDEYKEMLMKAKEIKAMASSFVETLSPYVKEGEGEDEYMDEEMGEGSEEMEESSEDESSGMSGKHKNLAIILALKKKGLGK